MSLLKKTRVAGDNVLSLNPSTSPLVNVLFLTYWEDGSDGDRMTGFIQSVLKRIEQNADSKGRMVPCIHWNYNFF